MIVPGVDGGRSSAASALCAAPRVALTEVSRLRSARSAGAVMAARATQPMLEGDQVRLTCEILADDLRTELKR